MKKAQLTGDYFPLAVVATRKSVVTSLLVTSFTGDTSSDIFNSMTTDSILARSVLVLSQYDEPLIALLFYASNRIPDSGVHKPNYGKQTNENRSKLNNNLYGRK